MSDSSPIPQTQPTDAAADPAEAIAAPSPSRGILRYIGSINNLYILLVLLGLAAFFSLISPNHAFFDPGNFLNIAWDSAETLLLAIGETFVIITAGIDLSVGTVLMLSGVVASWVMAQTAGTPAQVVNGQFPHAGRAILLGVLAGLAVGTVGGAINGALVTRLRMPPFIVTLGVFSVANGLGDLISSAGAAGQNAIPPVPDAFANSAGSSNLLLGLPTLVAGIASDAFYITMNHGAQAEAKMQGASVQFTGSPLDFSPATQLPYLNAAIARKPDLILIAPTDKVALQAPIQRAVNAHIPVILVDTTLQNPSIAVTTISSDNIAGGVRAADALAKAIGYKGKVAGVSVNPGISTTDQRLQGFNQELKRYPHIVNIGTTYATDSATRASTVLKALVAGHRDLAGVFAMNVVTGDGVTTAAREAGLAGKLKLVEFDAEPVQVQAVKNGTITALIAQAPYTIGQLGVRYGIQYLNGNHHLQKHYGTGEAISTKSNLNDPSIKNYLYSK